MTGGTAESPHTNGYGGSVFPQHQKLLQESGVDPAVAAERGYVSVDRRARLKAAGFSSAQPVPGLLIPIHGVMGEVVLHQYRPDSPRKNGDGKPIKYETPSGSRMALDVPPRVLPRLADPNRPLLITEGSRKADAAVSAALDCISVLGVWNWRGTNELGGKVALADWESVALNGREVVIVFDSDVMEKTEVQQALVRLQGFLSHRGAKVSLIYLPPGPDGAKVGLDDYLAAGHTAEQLLSLRSPELRAIQSGVGILRELPTGSADLPPAPIRPTPRAFFDQNGIVPARLGAHLQAERPIVLGYDRRLWGYDEGAYRPTEDWIRHRLRQIIGERFKKRHLEEVLAWLRAVEPTLGATPPTDVLNVRNGLLDWRTGELKPHSSEVLTTVQLPVRWNAGATCPAIKRFFDEVLPADALEFVAEVIGYALFPANPFHKAVLLHGPGRNGKSTLLGLITALLGEGNIASVPLQTLAENRFAAADLFGKLANISGDLDARAVKRTDQFKMLTPILHVAG